METSILVVDDEKEIADLVELYLQNEGFSVCKCLTGEQALEEIAARRFDLAILDVMLPGLSGFDLCRKIREQYHYPIIMLTAKVADIDKITGLTIGADDYVTKPFNPLELVARVKAQLRRMTRYNEPPAPPDEEILDFSGLIINKKTHECFFNEERLSLTPTEFAILWILCKNRGEVVSSERIFREAWGDRYDRSCNNTVMVHIRHLRQKMREPVDNPKFIKTIWGVGYKIEG